MGRLLRGPALKTTFVREPLAPGMCPFHPGQKVPQDPRKNQSLDTNVLTAGPVSARRAAARLVSVVAVWSQEAIRRPSPASVKVTVLQHPLPPPGGLAGASPRRPLAGLRLSASEPERSSSCARPPLAHDARAGAQTWLGASPGAEGGGVRGRSTVGFPGGARWGGPHCLYLHRSLQVRRPTWFLPFCLSSSGEHHLGVSFS